MLLPWLILGYAFLYAPIAFLMVFSFNAAKLVTVWSGFSFRWYGVLARDGQMIDAALLSLRIAAASATLALIVGTLAGYALARFGPFRGRQVFAAALAAPLILWLIACYAFLYAPITFLIAFSFNASRMVTVWAGFSTRFPTSCITAAKVTGSRSSPACSSPSSR